MVKYFCDNCNKEMIDADFEPIWFALKDWAVDLRTGKKQGKIYRYGKHHLCHKCILEVLQKGKCSAMKQH